VNVNFLKQLQQLLVQNGQEEKSLKCEVAQENWTGSEDIR
jgi:hypothetical protein